jgi:hypothetical protein
MRNRKRVSFWPAGARGEHVWIDPRTGIRLAPGATQNWPSKSDEQYIKAERRAATAVARAQELKEKKQASLALAPDSS